MITIFMTICKIMIQLIISPRAMPYSGLFSLSKLKYAIARTPTAKIISSLNNSSEFVSLD